MAKVFFVSDAHIKSPNDDRHRRFVLFLDHVLKSKATHLFILGDLFEFLYRDTDYIFRIYKEIFEKLRVLSDTGVKIYYLYGNHDFSFISRDGIIFVEDKVPLIEISGKKLCIFHGDGLDPSDIKYRILKRFLRGRLFKLIAGILPDPLLYGIAGVFSSLSRNINISSSARNGRGWLPYRNNAIDVLGSSDVDIVVYAHTHVAELSMLKSPKTASSKLKLYVNTGFFGRYGTYCMMDDDIVSVGVFKD